MRHLRMTSPAWDQLAGMLPRLLSDYRPTVDKFVCACDRLSLRRVLPRRPAT